MEKYKNILFDLDGTLTDSKIGIIKSVSYALEKFDIVVEDVHSLEKFIGPPLGESFTLYYGMENQQLETAIKYYREYFSQKGIFENNLYPGVEKILRDLKCQNKKVILATSKPLVFAEQIVNYFNVSHYFNIIEGSKLDGGLSQKSELIAYILEKYTLDKHNSIMIGDRKHDVIGAQTNQMDSVGVGYGYGSKEELMRAGAVYYVSSVNSLHDLLLNRNEVKEDL